MGGSGTGKSMVSAVFLSRKSQMNKFNIGAFHFCLHYKPKDSHPHQTIISIAAQLSKALPELHDNLKVDGNLLSIDIKDVFKKVVQEPLTRYVSNNFIKAILQAIEVINTVTPIARSHEHIS